MPIALILCVAFAGTTSQPEADPDALVPGLVVTFSGDAATSAKSSRETPDLAWNWGKGSPDARFPANGFRAEAAGWLLVQSPGEYRFFVRADPGARIALRIGATNVFDGKGVEESPPLTLRPGFQALRLEYERGEAEARLAIDWIGPGFTREPIPARLLYHDTAGLPKLDPFEAGRRLADRLGCANCHAVLDLPRHPSLGPSLNMVTAPDSGWLHDWLKNPLHSRPRTPMPSFGEGLSDSDASDLTAFLKQVGGRGAAISGEMRMALNVANAESGRLLFRSVGCLGCHGHEGSAGMASTRPAAPDLAGLGRKWTAPALASYLEHPRPGKGPSRHRPDLRLTADESGHLAAYLVDDLVSTPAKRPDGSAAGGRKIAERLRCAACHEIPTLGIPAAVVRLDAKANPERGCLADAPQAEVPRFSLSDEEHRNLRTFVSSIPANPAPSSLETLAHDSIRRRNCLGCHIRDAEGGKDLAGRLALFLRDDRDLGALKGRLTPPNLTAVGDKLSDGYLDKAIRGAAPTARPWLTVRMPVFSFEKADDKASDEASNVAAAFRSKDRMNRLDEAVEVPAVNLPKPQIDAAASLMGQRGFGCLSCHVLAGRIPPGGEPETLGPDLALAHRRMTERYFRRWVADPQRIIAGTPMPQFLKPVAGHSGILDEQLGLIWKLLGSPSIGNVVSLGTREVLKRQGDRALIVFDMVLIPKLPGSQYTPRGLSIGLKNDASLLFDADRLSWLAWWSGGFLSRTKEGRLWEWHPEGRLSWVTTNRPPPVVLIGAGGEIRGPKEERERFGSFKQLEFLGAGVGIEYQLKFGPGENVLVREEIQPTRNGWSRLVNVSQAPPGTTPAIFAAEARRTTETSGGIRWEDEGVALTLRVLEGGKIRPISPERGQDFLVPCVGQDGDFKARISVDFEAKR